MEHQWKVTGCGGIRIKTVALRRQVHVLYVEDEVTLRQGFVLVFLASPIRIIPPIMKPPTLHITH